MFSETIAFTSAVFLLSRVCVSVFCCFPAVMWVGLWFMIVVFPGHTQLLFIVNDAI